MCCDLQKAVVKRTTKTAIFELVGFPWKVHHPHCRDPHWTWRVEETFLSEPSGGWSNLRIEVNKTPFGRKKSFEVVILRLGFFSFEWNELDAFLFAVLSSRWSTFLDPRFYPALRSQKGSRKCLLDILPMKFSSAWFPEGQSKTRRTDKQTHTPVNEWERVSVKWASPYFSFIFPKRSVLGSLDVTYFSVPILILYRTCTRKFDPVYSRKKQVKLQKQKVCLKVEWKINKQPPKAVHESSIAHKTLFKHETHYIEDFF